MDVALLLHIFAVAKNTFFSFLGYYFTIIFIYSACNIDMKGVATCQIYIRFVRKDIRHCELFFPLCDHSVKDRYGVEVVVVVVIRINISIISIMTL